METRGRPGARRNYRGDRSFIEGPDRWKPWPSFFHRLNFRITSSSPAPTTYRITLAEEADTAVVTYKRLEELPRTSYARLAHYLGDGGLVPGTEWGPLAYCNRASTRQYATHARLPPIRRKPHG